ncbi:hypothetical protein NDU88_005747 [Pleurodeles waltl]|uniref:Tf2-1-like SH3-like domain-containing protein n=1 Tax=Pleurodeles waltl TaxID=8319 RepID=A0AAV7MYG1_PLEWA|nr:hypothetical protein NDU88_005747 [Pleurodeles waltl]
MLAEQWEESDDEIKDLLTYTKELRVTLHSVWEKAHNTLRDSQEKQKKGYDTSSVLRSLKVGDKALVLLPSSENKLLARWQGPYEVLEQSNPTTYKLALPHGHGSRLSPREPGEIKGQDAELGGGADGRRGYIQEASEDPTRRLVRTQGTRRLLGPSAKPKNRARPEQGIIAVPTRDEDSRPQEADS